MIDPGAATAEAGGGLGTVGGAQISLYATSEGTFIADSLPVSFTDLADLGRRLGTLAPDFFLPSNPVQAWDVDFTGDFEGSAILSFAYDETALLPGVQEADLFISHYIEPFEECAQGVDCGWVALTPLSIDTVANVITIETSSFSPFALGATTVAEPAGLALLGLLAAGLAAAHGTGRGWSPRGTGRRRVRGEAAWF